jgi:ribosome-associated toxin RatA of RatAB toxin-antitoxin module
VDTSIGRRIKADPDTVFRLAAAVEDWPRILPHYRWVRVLARASQECRTVEMAARRDVVGRLGIPLRWTAIEISEPRSRRIEFEHIRGVTRGMRVAWSIEPATDGPGLLVQIRHVFEPRWGLPDWLVQQIVGEYFVNGVARRTLRRIGEIAEALQDRSKDA